MTSRKGDAWGSWIPWYRGKWAQLYSVLPWDAPLQDPLRDAAQAVDYEDVCPDLTLVVHRRAQRAYEADTTQRPWYRSPPRFPVTPDEGRVGHNLLLLLGEVYLIREDREVIHWWVARG